MALVKYAREGDMIPELWYAIAWRDFDTDRAVCYPVGLHFLMRWSRDLWCWVRGVGLPGYGDRLYIKAQGRANKWALAALEQERQNAWDDGYGIGYRQGRQDAIDDALKGLDEHYGA